MAEGAYAGSIGVWQRRNRRLNQPGRGHWRRGGNLRCMDFDNAARARIARGWLNSSLDQRAYAAQHGISTRTLRQWVSRYGAPDRPAARAKAIIDTAINQLQALRTALDAEEERLSGTTDEPAQERRAAAAERTSAVPSAPVVSPLSLTGAAESVRAHDAEEACRSGTAPVPYALIEEVPHRNAGSEGKPLPPVRDVANADVLQMDNAASKVSAEEPCAVASPRRRPGGFFAQPENWT